MWLKSIHTEGFRNLLPGEICFNPGIQLLVGANGQGKSNFLEAVSYLSMASSFRNAREGELVTYGDQYFYLRGRVQDKNGSLCIEAAGDKERRRRWKINGEKQSRLSQVVGIFHGVIFAPEDIWLVKAGPDHRRRYLNRQLSQVSSVYCRAQLQYNHILQQRNAYLKQIAAEQPGEELEIWDQQLIDVGSRIIAQRLEALEKLDPLANQALSRIAPGESISLHYQSPLLREGYTKDVEELSLRFSAELKRQRHNELLRRLSLIGPHRDDILINLNGKAARSYASQGQQRSIALVLKLAELELANITRGEYPVLLLDDVFSELDQYRRRQILELAERVEQAFVTATDSEQWPKASLWMVDKGKVGADNILQD